MTGGYSQERMSTRPLTPGTLSFRGRTSSVGKVKVDLQLTGRWTEWLAVLSRPAALGPVADYFAATTGVVVDAPIGRLDGKAAGGRPGDDRVKAPALAVDLDDVAGVDALESHARTPA